MSEYQVKGVRQRNARALALAANAAALRPARFGGCGPPALRSASRARVVPGALARGPRPTRANARGLPVLPLPGLRPSAKMVVAACSALLRSLPLSGAAAPGPLPLRSPRRGRRPRPPLSRPRSGLSGPRFAPRGRAPAVPPGSVARPLVRRFAAPRALAAAAVVSLPLAALRAPCPVALAPLVVAPLPRVGRRVPPRPSALRRWARRAPARGPGGCRRRSLPFGPRAWWCSRAPARCAGALSVGSPLPPPRPCRPRWGLAGSARLFHRGCGPPRHIWRGPPRGSVKPCVLSL